MKFERLSELVNAVQSGEVDPRQVYVEVDNDTASATLRGKEVWRGGGPTTELIALLCDLGLPAEGA